MALIFASGPPLLCGLYVGLAQIPVDHKTLSFCCHVVDRLQVLESLYSMGQGSSIWSGKWPIAFLNDKVFSKEVIIIRLGVNVDVPNSITSLNQAHAFKWYVVTQLIQDD